METTNKDKRKFFDEMAPRWDGVEAPPNAAIRQKEFLRQATNHEPSRILDAGCGTGILVFDLQKLCPNASIVELDFSMEMLAVNRSIHGNLVSEYCCDAIESAPFVNDLLIPFSASTRSPILILRKRCRNAPNC